MKSNIYYFPNLTVTQLQQNVSLQNLKLNFNKFVWKINHFTTTKVKMSFKISQEFRDS